MSVAVDVAWSKYKASAELERIGTQMMLAEAALLRTLARGRVCRAEHMQNVGRLETGGAIGAPVRVDQQRERYSRLFAELHRIVGISQTDGGEFRSSCLELGLVFAQLRGVLAAEDSSIVAQENDDRRGGCPQGAEANGGTLGVGQRDVC